VFVPFSAFFFPMSMEIVAKCWLNWRYCGCSC